MIARIESRDGAGMKTLPHSTSIVTRRGRAERARAAHFMLEQRHDHEARRRRRRQTPRHACDETAPAQQHYRPISELM